MSGKFVSAALQEVASWASICEAMCGEVIVGDANAAVLWFRSVCFWQVSSWKFMWVDVGFDLIHHAAVLCERSLLDTNGAI